MKHVTHFNRLLAALLSAAATVASGAALERAQVKEPLLASALKDALRTVTGLVACASAGSRPVRTPTATAGIR